MHFSIVYTDEIKKRKITKGTEDMKNDRNEIRKENKPLSDEEMKNVSGGMKIITEDEEKEEEKSWIRTIIDFFFKLTN